MKKSAAAMFLALTLLTSYTRIALAEDLAKAAAESAITIANLAIKNQIALYTMCMMYNAGLGRWPADRKEFEEYFLNLGRLSDEEKASVAGIFKTITGAKDSSKLTQNAMKAFFDGIDIGFTPMDTGDVLIEGGFNKEFTRTIESAGVSKCRFCVVASRKGDRISFTPSEKYKDNRDYLSFPLSATVKKPE